MQIPDKQECFYIFEMLESGIIDYSYIHPWAEGIIENTNAPPLWLHELAGTTHRFDQLKVLGAFIHSEPIEPAPKDIEKFHVGCFWLRYERREFSWATFLDRTGDYLDRADRDWDCETPYHYLNCHEDAYFTTQSEEETKNRYLQDHDLRPWIELAREKFEPFKSQIRLTKADSSET